MSTGGNIKLKDIFIGYADGESEAQEDNFVNIFYKGNNKYSEIMDNHLKFIISGNKGTGKTILARYIEHMIREKGDICKVSKMNDINLRRLIELGYKDLEEYELVAFSKWIILSEISELLILNKKSLKDILKNKSYMGISAYMKYRKNMKTLNNFFNIRYPKGNYKSNTYNEAESYSSTIEVNQSIDKFSSFKNNFNMSNKKDSSYSKKSYYDTLDEVEEIVFQCLGQANIVLIFDDLDELECKLTENTIYVRFFIALLESLRDINGKLRKNNYLRSKIILLIRSDILSELNKHSSNLNKLITDSQVNLYWIDKHYSSPEKHSLMDLILTKIQNSNVLLKDISKKDLYLKLFPEMIESKSAINYLLDYGFGRPRDVITYLNILRENNSESTSFKATMIRQGRVQYSRWFRDELFNELKLHAEPKYVDECFKLLSDFSRPVFDYTSIHSYFNINQRRYSSIPNSEDCIEFLYKYGVIGNTWDSNSTSGKNRYKYSWAYRNDGSPTVDFNKKFVVHYALRKCLSI